MLVCIYEDRHSHVPGVQLLVASLARHAPDWAIRLRFPQPPEAFVQWCAQYPQITLVQSPLEGAGSYNIKPHVLLDGLRAQPQHACCLWLDTDVIVRGSLSMLDERQVSPEVLVGTLDPWADTRGCNWRTQAFHLPVGRDLDGPINSAVVRVSHHHVALLEAWVELLRLPEYQAAQATPVAKRNPLMLGDQDVLSALVASVGHAQIPLRLLAHPTEVLHHHGAGAFAAGSRWRMRLPANLPPLLHAMGTTKPWMMQNQPTPWRSRRAWYERLYLEVSPYLVEARSYRHVLSAPAPWLEVQTLWAKVALAVCGGNSVLAGWPQAWLHPRLRRWLG